MTRPTHEDDDIRNHPVFALLKKEHGWTDDQCAQFLKEITEYLKQKH
jgi:hypothetical protein